MLQKQNSNFTNQTFEKKKNFLMSYSTILNDNLTFFFFSYVCVLCSAFDVIAFNRLSDLLDDKLV